MFALLLFVFILSSIERFDDDGIEDVDDTDEAPDALRFNVVGADAQLIVS